MKETKMIRKQQPHNSNSEHCPKQNKND